MKLPMSLRRAACSVLGHRSAPVDSLSVNLRVPGVGNVVASLPDEVLALYSCCPRCGRLDPPFDQGALYYDGASQDPGWRLRARA